MLQDIKLQTQKTRSSKLMRVGMGIRVGKEGHADQKFIRFGV